MSKKIKIFAFCVMMIAAFMFGRIQGAPYRVVNSINSNDDLILNIDAGKLFLNHSSAERICREVTETWGQNPYTNIHIYVYKNSWDRRRVKLFAESDYFSSDPIRYNTRDNPEKFTFQMKEPSW